MSGIFTSRCKGKVRKNDSWRKLPLDHRNISKTQYLRETLYKAWRYHLAFNNLQVEDVVFRKIIYDAVYDALENENGKNHHKDFLREYAEFQKIWNEHYVELNEKIVDWENYRNSKNYQLWLEKIREIKRTDRRIQANVNMALAYMYAKHQKSWEIGEKFIDLEKTLKLDLIEKAWSKKWLWFLTTLLVFDANNLYANTIGNNQYQIKDFDALNFEAIKIYVTRWYERKDISLSDEWKTLAKIYDNIIVPVIGELGSVALAEAASLPLRN